MKPFKKVWGKARALPRGVMNKLESEYAAYLERLKQAGQILGWHYEAVTLWLANNTSYRPDFMVVTAPDGVVEFHETKGYWKDDARVKIKVAARLFPWFRFIGVTKATKKTGGGWKIEEFQP